MSDQELKMKVLIVDDEIEACRNLKNILVDYVDRNIQVAGLATSAAKAEVMVAEHNPDAIFLDIEMPNENAFHFLKRITPYSFEVIFVTAYDEYAIRAFKLNAVDYILKPISIDELSIAVSKLRDRIRFKRLIDDEQGNGAIDIDFNEARADRITLRENAVVELVRFEDIIYVEANGSYSKIFFLKDGESMHMTTSYSIADYEELFPTQSFYRVHKSYLINSRYITRILKDESSSIVMYPSITVPISRRRVAPLMAYLKSQNTL